MKTLVNFFEAQGFTVLTRKAEDDVKIYDVVETYWKGELKGSFFFVNDIQKSGQEIDMLANKVTNPSFLLIDVKQARLFASLFTVINTIETKLGLDVEKLRNMVDFYSDKMASNGNDEEFFRAKESIKNFIIRECK